ncbi:UNVERIFIED_CONTAM: hypothetical protein HDU68_009078 [Siphonaria sp. JEL0065]|nr:hypothetical protein HDU68_009078 [Siphonaria sp. JEL0065]
MVYQQISQPMLSERDEFINAFVAKTVQAASVLFDQYQANKQSTASKSPVPAFMPAPQKVPSINSHDQLYLATPLATPMMNPLLPPSITTMQHQFHLPSSAFAYPPVHDQLSMFASPITNPQPMNFEEAEAILSSPLCSPMLGASASPYLQRRMSSFNLPSASGSTSRRPSTTPALRRSSLLSNTSTMPYNLPMIPVPESRSASGTSDLNQVVEPTALTFSPLTPSRLSQSPDSAVLIEEREHETDDSQLTAEYIQALRQGAEPIETKKRTRLTSAQREYMMSVFKKDQNPPSAVVREVADNVGISFRLVQYWFQNRRAALRRKKAAGRSKILYEEDE